MAPAPPSSFILGNNHLSRDSVGLGRLVRNKGKPQEDYYPPPPEIPIKENVIEDKDITSHTAKTGGAGSIQRFMDYVSLRLTKQRSRVSRIRSEGGVKEYTLDNSGEHFRNLLKHTEARKWIETACVEGRNVYLLVGYKTLQDAVIVEYDKKINSADVGARIREVSVEGSVNWNKDDSTLSTGIASGEQVFAVMYRKVEVKHHKLQKSKSGDPQPTLQDGQWVVLTKHRQAHTTETVDVLEAEIIESEERDEFDFDDDDEDDEEDQWTKVADEKGDFYL